MSDDWGKSKYEGLTFDIDDIDDIDDNGGSSPYHSEEEESFARTFKKAMELNFSTSPPCPPLPSFHTFFPSPPSLVPASPCSSYSMSPSNSSPLLLSLPPTQTQTQTQTQVILENVIPEDVLPLVCSFLQARELLTIGMASKSMNAISNDPTLWIRLVSSVFGTCVDELSPPDAQEVYKVMNRRLRDLKAGALECTWSKEMRLRGHSI